MAAAVGIDSREMAPPEHGLSHRALPAIAPDALPCFDTSRLIALCV